MLINNSGATERADATSSRPQRHAVHYRQRSHVLCDEGCYCEHIKFCQLGVESRARKVS